MTTVRYPSQQKDLLHERLCWAASHIRKARDLADTLGEMEGLHDDLVSIEHYLTEVNTKFYARQRRPDLGHLFGVLMGQDTL